MNLLPHVIPAMLEPEYWISRQLNPNQIILSPFQIAALNQKIQTSLPHIMVDLNNYPFKLSRHQVLKLILESSPFSPVQHQHTHVTWTYQTEIWQNINSAAIPTWVEPVYGYSLRRCNLRRLPTNEPLYDSPTVQEFDLIQENAINPGEPLIMIMLHQNSEATWIYVQTSSARGWVLQQDLIEAPSRSHWLSYLNQPNFLWVTAANLNLEISPETALFYQMGARIPLLKFDHRSHWLLPIDHQIRSLPFNPTGEVREAPLPCNITNLLQQAFKFLFTPYGWGGKNQGIDCSGFVKSIYLSCGINLPGNTWEQVACGLKTISFNPVNSMATKKILSSLPAGSLLWLKGHILLYLGEVSRRYYAIHALSAYRDSLSGKRLPINEVTVSDLEILRLNGKTILQSLAAALVLES